MATQDPGHLFLCPNGRMLPRWKEAFKTGKAGKVLTARPVSWGGRVNLVWLQLESGVPVAVQMAHLAPVLKRVPCVVLSDLPTDEEAIAAFSAGARGYSNSHAAAEVLIQVAAVVLQGGLWIGESLMLRLVGATSRIQTAARGATATGKPDWSALLTGREQEVATTLAAGASNKEIARTLGITERTVKAHVGAILEKLQVRDRLQLSLVVNGQASRSLESAGSA